MGKLEIMSAARLAEVRAKLATYEDSPGGLLADDAAHDCARMLGPVLARLDALHAGPVPDGEALGQMLLARLTAELSPTWAKVLSDVEDEHWNRAAIALYQRGHAAACVRSETFVAEQAATIARLQAEVAGAARLAAVLSAHWPDDLPAVEERSPVTVADVAGRVLLRMQEEQERLTAELAASHDRAIVFGRNVVASTERAMQVQIDAWKRAVEALTDLRHIEQDDASTDEQIEAARDAATDALQRAGGEGRPPCPGEGWEWDAFALQWHQPGAKGRAIATSRARGEGQGS